ncbi:ice-binding family protein [Rhodohalobacter sp.]|uniref:ice-binding family protein n=1 Tax=Rhodohalobacter sp. TaxID=1974210 RepID=UPI00356ACAFD
MIITKFFNASMMAALFLASFMVGCDTSTDADIDPDAPEVFSTTPISNQEDVERNMVLEIVFDEAMDATTMNNSTITLQQGSTTINGIVDYSGTTATFTPENVFAAQTDYTANISIDAKNSSGVALSNDYEWNFTTGGSTEQMESVNLGTAGNYVVLAKSAINNNPTSTFTGDMGLSPAAESFITGFSQTAETGYSTSDQVTGRIYAADMVDPTPSNLTTAVENMATAYDDAAGRTSPDFVELYTGEIGGKTLSPGLYKWSNTVLITDDVTFSGDENAVWILQIAENVTMSSDVSITLTGGAQAQNIIWQVAGEATIGTTSHFEGIILSMTGITLNTGASLNGRILAQTAAIFDANTVVAPQ